MKKKYPCSKTNPSVNTVQKNSFEPVRSDVISKISKETKKSRKKQAVKKAKLERLKKKERQKAIKEKNELKTTGKVVATSVILGFGLTLGVIGTDFVKLAVTKEKDGVHLVNRAYELYSTQQTIRSRRGTIYDRQGSPIAEELTSYKIYANLNPNYGSSYVEDLDYTAEKLSEKLNMSKADILTRLSKKGASQVEFGAAGRALSYLEMNEIKELNLPGIEFVESSNRFYPNGAFASHSIGYAVYDSQANALVGHMGLELAFDKELSGQNGQIAYFRDRKGYLLPNTEPDVLVEAKDGIDIYTTLDFNLQNTLEAAMDEAYETYQPENLIAVVADAKTGEILAAANRKTFDPNLRDVENYYNPIIQHPFEPGSTLKIFTYAAAINEGNYQGNQYYSTGSTRIGGMTIKDWKPQGWGSITLDQGFHISSNTAIMKLLSENISTDTFLDYLKAFGFGDPTELGLPNESAGTLPRENDYTNQLTAGFGQGFLVTPLQQIRALTAILNGGEMLQPYLVSKTYDPNTGKTTVTEREVIGKPITAETAEKVKELMYGAVNDPQYGSAYTAYRMEDIPSAGKTGTAQIADEKNGGYLRGANDYIYSFMGFAPYDDPEYIVYLAIDRPAPGNLSGHGILGGIYKEVLRSSLNHSTSAPVETTESTEPSLVTVGNYKHLPTEEAVTAIEALGLKVTVIGDGDTVYAQSVQKDSTLMPGDRIFLQTGAEKVFPDLTGWTHSDLMSYQSLTGAQFVVEGRGFVSQQSIEAGQAFDETKECHISLSLELPLDEDPLPDEASNEETESGDSESLSESE